MALCRSASHPCGVAEIKLHYIRLLAGLGLVRSAATAPASNPTEQRAHIHQYTDFLHPIFFSSFHLLIHSCILAQHFPLFSISYCVFSYFSLSPFTTHSPSLSFSLGKWCILLSSCLVGTHWKAGRASSAVSSCPHRVYNPLDVLPLLLRTQKGGTMFEHPYCMSALHKVFKNKKINCTAVKSNADHCIQWSLRFIELHSQMATHALCYSCTWGPSFKAITHLKAFLWNTNWNSFMQSLFMRKTLSLCSDFLLYLSANLLLIWSSRVTLISPCTKLMSHCSRGRNWIFIDTD